MAKQIIAFFSSDARKLYKGDVFRVLSLPSHYVIHFRYEREYIQDEIKTEEKDLINKEGVIYYTSGNDTTIPKENRVIKNTSIRNVLIKDVFYDEYNKMVNFCLELLDFCDYKPHENTMSENLPPYKFVTKILVGESPNNDWIDRVKAIQNEFNRPLFFYISSVLDNKNRELIPAYSLIDKASHYELDEESEYKIEISLYDPTNGTWRLKVEDIGDSVRLVIPPGYVMSSHKNTERFTLYTQSISKQKSVGFSRLNGFSNTDTANSCDDCDLTVELRWKVVRNLSKIILFGVYSGLAAMGVFGLSAALKDFSSVPNGSFNIAIGLFSILLIGVAAAMLYRVFNKK